MKLLLSVCMLILNICGAYYTYSEMTATTTIRGTVTNIGTVIRNSRNGHVGKRVHIMEITPKDQERYCDGTVDITEEEYEKYNYGDVITYQVLRSKFEYNYYQDYWEILMALYVTFALVCLVWAGFQISMIID